MKGILLPRNYFKFPFVKVIVSKIACKSLYNTKNEHFLTAYHQKVVRENFFRGFGDILSIKNMFKPIRIINRSHSQLIWTCTGEKRNHWKKVDHVSGTSPPKKNAHLLTNVDFFSKIGNSLKSWIFAKFLYFQSQKYDMRSQQVLTKIILIKSMES